MIYKLITIVVLSFVLNFSNSLASRSRNRNNATYHLIATTVSNAFWFLTFRMLVLSGMRYIFFIPYLLGTVTGSVLGSHFSMRVEKRLNASADGHLKGKENDSRI